VIVKERNLRGKEHCRRNQQYQSGDTNEGRNNNEVEMRGNQGADEELARTRAGEVVGSRGGDKMGGEKRKKQTDNQNRGTSDKERQYEGECDVKLPLDGERPEVQERARVVHKIAALLHCEEQVSDVQRACHGSVAHTQGRRGHEENGRQQSREHKHHRSGRNQTPSTAHEEFAK
jgi:hypothetical protein